MKKTLIIPNENKDVNLAFTQKIVNLLTRQGVEITLSDRYSIFNITDVRYVSDDILFDNVDFAITVGGDGTILRFAEKLSKANIPVVGINLGRLGFMTELEPDEIALLNKIVNDDYTIDKRMMMDVSVSKGEELIFHHCALNDVVVSNGSVSKIAELELFCDNTYVSLYHADGLIVSTPTGSTAYSLSAGGSIIDPSINCLLLTPVCPHSFYNSRSIVFSPNSHLRIKNVQENEDNTYLTVDGKTNQKISNGDFVNISTSPQFLQIIKIKDKKFYDRVYQKISER